MQNDPANLAENTADSADKTKRGLVGSELTTLLLILQALSCVYEDGKIEGVPLTGDVKPQGRLDLLSEAFRKVRAANPEGFQQLVQNSKNMAEIMASLDIRITSSENPFLRKLVRQCLVKPAVVDTELCAGLGVDVQALQQTG